MPPLTRLLELVDRLEDEKDERRLGSMLDEIRDILQQHTVGPEVTPAGAPPVPETAVAGVRCQDGICYPKTVDEVKALVNYARANGRKVRVAGSRHSTPGAIFGGSGDVSMILSGELRCVDFSKPDVVWVGGGCYLGVNDEDPDSTLENSLNYQLNKMGYSLPTLGGITHQSIAGFMQTGSSGGSLAYHFASAVSAIEFVDGSGNLQCVKDGTKEFYAAGVAMGLFGVITHVELRRQNLYYVEGTEVTYKLRDSVLQKSGTEYPLFNKLKTAEYFHLNWYPQKGVNRVTQWEGKRCATPGHCPYKDELSDKFKATLAALILYITDTANHIDPYGKRAQRMIACLMRLLVKVPNRQSFHDIWYTTLPSDDQTDTDTWLKIIFTEIWIPMGQLTAAVDAVFQVLQDPKVAGNLIIELYGSKQSPFWLSPSHRDDVVRVDVFWWAHNRGTPQFQFTAFWNALLGVPGALLHWGKNLPVPGTQYGTTKFGRDLFRQRYPQFDEWLTMRRNYDPNQVFVTDYWKQMLGL